MSKNLQKESESELVGDLSITALYTAQTWHWSGFDGAELFVSDQSRIIFRVTNLFLALAKLFNWRLRSLKISLAHRHALIDRLVESQSPDMVLEVAAGLSRRGYSMSKDLNLHYYEVDRPGVVAQKKGLIDSRTSSQVRPNWIIGEGDALTLDYVEKVSKWDRPVVIAEGLLMYLKAEEQRLLWARVAEAIGDKPGAAFIFDLVPQNEQPKPGVFGRLLGWLMKRFTGGSTFVRDNRGREDIQAELLAAGFGRVEMIEPYRVAESYGLPFPEYRSQQLVFTCRAMQDRSSD